MIKSLEALNDISVRIDAMWPFPMQNAPEWLVNAFEDRDLEDLPQPIADFFASLDDDVRDDLVSGDEDRFHEAWEEVAPEAWWKNISGWIAVASCPVFKATGNGGAAFSWGHWRTKLFFAENPEAILAAATAWGEVQFDAAVQEGGAA